jgi:two-component system sensor histidine kinase DesK
MTAAAGATVAVVERTPFVRPRPRYAWLWAGIWLVYLFGPLDRAWHLADPTHKWLGVAVILAFAGCFIGSFFVLPPMQRGSIRHGTAIGIAFVVTAAALATTVTVLLDDSSLPLFVYVGVMSLFLLPGRWGLATVGGLVVGTAVAQRVVPGWKPDYSVQFSILVSGFAMWGVLQIILRNRELAAAREEITRLAIAEERNRFARDLHDILGHSLTVVSVKAELASRLVRRDPDRAAVEIADVQRLAREALTEVRSAVAGYRDVTLAGELANARSALSAAGIDADLPNAIDDVPHDHRELFGWVIREGVTNVVRHSGASRCRVRVTPSEVEVSDDGQPSTLEAASGHGLAGLRERAEAAGGSLSVQRSSDGFQLLVRV